MFWSGETLVDRLPTLSDDFRPDAVDCNAWTLTIGSQIYITPVASSPIAPDRLHSIRVLGEGEHFVIPPGQFAFLETRERVCVPNHAMAFISIKATNKLEGLVNVSGFHVDPGFDGVLVFTVFNAGPNHIRLQHGQKFFLIWYASLDRETEYRKVEPSKRRVSGEAVKGFGQLQSFDDFSKRLNEVERKVHNYASIGNWIAALAVAVLATVVGVYLSKDPKPTPSQISPAPPAPIASPATPTPLASPTTPASAPPK